MKLKTLSAASLLALGLVSVAGASQAANYAEIDGTNVQFLYDADFWGANTATVTGNSISFDIGSDYALAAKVKATSLNGASVQDYSDSAFPGLIAVAKNGYQLLGTVDTSLTADYSTSAKGGFVNASAYGYLHQGSFSNGAFNADPSKWSVYSVMDDGFSNGAATSGTLNTVTQAGAWDGLQAMSLEVTLGSHAEQSGPGLSSIAMTNVSYGFAVMAAPVPEPETCAMLLAGLGLVGVMARRRKAKA